jgi:hypothetical protein
MGLRFSLLMSKAPHLRRLGTAKSGPRRNSLTDERCQGVSGQGTNRPGSRRVRIPNQGVRTASNNKNRYCGETRIPHRGLERRTRVNGQGWIAEPVRPTPARARMAPGRESTPSFDTLKHAGAVEKSLIERAAPVLSGRAESAELVIRGSTHRLLVGATDGRMFLVQARALRPLAQPLSPPTGNEPHRHNQPDPGRGVGCRCASMGCTLLLEFAGV